MAVVQSFVTNTINVSKTIPSFMKPIPFWTFVLVKGAIYKSGMMFTHFMKRVPKNGI